MTALKEHADRTFNLKGLPCAWVDDRYVLFDPYNLKLATFTERPSEDDPATLDKLTSAGFCFDPPIKSIAADRWHVSLILTTNCNLACGYCYVSSRTNLAQLDPELACSILDECIDYSDPVYLQLFGGEPTINLPCIKQVTRHVLDRKPDPFFYITTNGVMTQDAREHLISHDFGIYLSLDGAQPLHDANRPTLAGRGSYEQAHESLRQFLEAGLAIKVRVTVNHVNVDNMSTFARAMFTKGVKVMHFSPQMAIGRGTRKDPLSSDAFQDRYLDQLEMCLDLAAEFGAKVITPATLAIGNRALPYCKIINDDRRLIITADGKQTLCYAVQENRDKGADMFITRDFDANQRRFLDRSGVQRQLRQVYGSNLTKCQTCSSSFICRGGCVAENLSRMGDAETFDPDWCRLHKKLVYLTLARIYRKTKCPVLAT